MYLIESVNDTQNIASNKTDTPDEFTKKMSTQDRETLVSPRWGFDQMVQLRALFLGLIKQKCWIYFFNEEIKIRADHLPVLQVKLKEHQLQFESICRIVTSGHCNAIVVEQNKMSSEELRSVQLLCIQHKVQFVLLENLLENDTLH